MLENLIFTHVAQATDIRERHLRWNPEFCRLLDEGCDTEHLIDWVLEAQYAGDLPITH
jgi:hypothetical protein